MFWSQTCMFYVSHHFSVTWSTEWQPKLKNSPSVPKGISGLCRASADAEDAVPGPLAKGVQTLGPAVQAA